MLNSKILLVGILLCLESDGSFLGGTISWMSFPQGVRFTYRLTWEKGTGPCGPGCSQRSIHKLGSLPPALARLHWRCTKGCAPKSAALSDINYIVTSVSFNASGWEQGEQFFFYKFPGNGTYEVTLDGFQWNGNQGFGRLVTTVILGLRNDTQTSTRPAVPNGSPIAALQPSVGIQFGCTSIIDLPVSDPDADTLKCRLALPSECRGACTNLPANTYTVKEDECKIKVMALGINGYIGNHDYHVTVMVEDYPDYTIKVGNEIRSIRHPISKIPLQFTVRTITDSRPCGFTNQLETFVIPTRDDNIRLPYPGPKLAGIYRNGVYLQTPDINKTEFMISVPARMNYVLLGDDYRNRTDVERIYLTMIPWINQSADTMACVWGRQDNGLTTKDKRCVTSIMYDFDNCKGADLCLHNGTCVNLYHRWTCKCPHGFKPRDCSQRVTCADFPCKNNGTCEDTGKNYRCKCIQGFTGSDCERRDHNNGTEKTAFLQVNIEHQLLWPTVLAVFTGLVLILLAMFCCFCILSESGQTEDKERHKRNMNLTNTWSGKPRPPPMRRSRSITPVT